LKPRWANSFIVCPPSDNSHKVGSKAFLNLWVGIDYLYLDAFTQGSNEKEREFGEVIFDKQQHFRNVVSATC